MMSSASSDAFTDGVLDAGGVPAADDEAALPRLCHLTDMSDEAAKA